MPPVSDQTRLDQMVRSAHHPCVFIPNAEEAYALALLRNAAMGAQQNLWLWNVVNGVRNGLFESTAPQDFIANTEHPAAALHHFAAHLKEQPCVCGMLDLAGHLQDERTLRCLRDVIERFWESGSTLVVIDHADRMHDAVTSDATRLELSLPGEEELQSIIRDTVKRMAKQQEVTATISRRDLDTIVRNLSGLTRRAAQQIVADVIIDDQKLCADDVNAVLARKRRLLQSDGVLEYVETPVSLDEIGGLTKLKRWLKERENALSEEAVAFGLSAPRGILLLGVQGAGKSLSAKAIATAWQRPLLRLDPGALYDRFIGESERKLRDALKQAEMMSPIVLWIDEIEKGFASAASHSVDGGLSQRMFGTLLTWMQEHEKPVFLVATANDIDALPPELLRKGRFDEIFFVDLPGAAVRKEIFAIHLKRRKRDAKRFDLNALAAASDGFSGAEIEQAVIAALHEAFADGAEVDTDRIVGVLKRSPPLSVTAVERVEALRLWAQGRCVPAE